jgi:PAS domain S-box-containing protein
MIFGYDGPIADWGWEPFLRAVLAEDRAMVAAGFEEAVAQGAGWDVRCRIRRRDGAQRWIEVRSKPVLDAAGRPERYFGTIADITEAQRGEAELRALNERLAREVAQRRADRERLDLTLNAASMIGMFDGDLVGQKIYADVNFANIYGVDPEVAARGVPSGFYFPQIHAEDRPSARAHFEQIVAQGERYAHEHRIIRPDGATRWVLVRGHLTRDADGRPTRFSGIALDQTERREAAARQEFLLGLADRLRTAGSAREALATAAEALGRYLGAHRVGFGQMLDEESVRVTCGYAEGAVPVDGTFPISAFGVENFARARRGLTNVSEDIQAEPGNRSEKWERIGTRAHVSVPLIREGAYRGSLYVSFMQPHRWAPEEVALIEEVAARLWDAQERLRAEAALREAKAELEDRVEAALTARAEIEAALRQSQKMEAVGQLTGGLAHDFNNLLTGISGSLELLKTRLAQGRVAEAGRYIAAARGAAERAASLTHRLLAFSRQQTLDAKPTEVNGLIAGMVELIQRTAGPEIKVTARLAAGLAPAFCDPHQLENAILNLAINARDAMDTGGALTISTWAVALDARAAAARELPAGEFIAIAVRDTGCGMAPEVVARAFDPFFTTKPLGQGTGLGLSMIYGFARQSEGTVWIETREGEGTEVTILLPRSHTMLADDGPAALPAPMTGAG